MAADPPMAVPRHGGVRAARPPRPVESDRPRAALPAAHPRAADHHAAPPHCGRRRPPVAARDDRRPVTAGRIPAAARARPPAGRVHRPRRPRGARRDFPAGSGPMSAQNSTPTQGPACCLASAFPGWPLRPCSCSFHRGPASAPQAPPKPPRGDFARSFLGSPHRSSQRQHLTQLALAGNGQLTGIIPASSMPLPGGRDEAPWAYCESRTTRPPGRNPRAAGQPE